VHLIRQIGFVFDTFLLLHGGVKLRFPQLHRQPVDLMPLYGSLIALCEDKRQIIYLQLPNFMIFGPAFDKKVKFLLGNLFLLLCFVVISDFLHLKVYSLIICIITQFLLVL